MEIFNFKINISLHRCLYVLIAFYLSCTIPFISVAYFGDTEISEDNGFDASSLGLALTLESESEDSRTLRITSDQEEDLEYYLVKTSAEGLFCSDVLVEITQDGDEIYDGSLSSFIQSSSSVLISGDIDGFIFEFSVANDAIAYSGECSITLSYKANQVGYTHGYAFFDTESDAFVLQASDFGTTPSTPTGVVLNEVLANPEGADGQGGLQGEWVELYNNGTTPVDLSGWYIEDLAGHTRVVGPSTTMNGQTVIGAEGSGNQWLVLFMNGEVLNNTGDTVTLYDASGVAKDTYAFGDHGNDADPDSNHTGGGDNDNPSGDETAGNEGKSDARIPDGTGAWIDPIPTPGGYNVLEKEVEPQQSEVSQSQFIFSSELPETEPETEANDDQPEEETLPEEIEKTEAEPVPVTEEEQKEEVEQGSEPEKMRPEEPSIEVVEQSPIDPE